MASDSGGGQGPPIQILRVTLAGGIPGLVAVSRSQPGCGYQITADDAGRFVCECPGWKYRQNCAHVAHLLQVIGEAKAEPATLPLPGLDRPIEVRWGG